MSTIVKLNIDDTDKILLKRNLEKGGKAQKFFANEVLRLSDPYTPMDTSMLKNNVSIAIDGSQITYHSPYAKKQFYENKGKGLRGKEWTNRMFADRGKEIIKSVAAFVGGKTT